MTLKRYVASKDSSIFDAYKEDLTHKATGSNAGAADVLEIFSIYGQANSSSIERSRAIIQFPIDQISLDRTNGNIPKSGSVNFYLKMFNVKHKQTVPTNFKIEACPISSSFDWTEGNGLDLEKYLDNGTVNWISRF